MTMMTESLVPICHKGEHVKIVISFSTARAQEIERLEGAAALKKKLLDTPISEQSIFAARINFLPLKIASNTRLPLTTRVFSRQITLNMIFKI